MRVLHSKHQKLILQCYPPGKGVDKKPNPSELSYLLYYASTRRVKLEKVIEYLKRKTKADVRSRKSGNLSVTLAIVSALITKCYDNLNAFAPQVCAILSLILPLKELPLCKALISTYCVFCAKLDNGLFSGDKEFVDAFQALTSDLIHLAESQSSVETTNRREWEMISLLTCRHVFSCLGFNAQLSSEFIPRTVAILASTVARCFTLDNLTSRLKTALNVEQGNGERLLTKITTVKSSAPLAFSGDSMDEELLTDTDLGEEALCGLRTLFHTSLSYQINEATKSVVEFDFAENKDNGASAWGTTFLQVCASYIPVQLRFELLLTLLDALSNIANRATEISNGFHNMRHYAKYIMSLVSSGFNMIGLSISDILHQFLTLKTNLYLKLSVILSPNEVSQLSTIYSDCICNLSSHIYYFDQVSDSIECILMQVDNVLVAFEDGQANKVYNLVLDLLEIIYNIMEILSANRSAITWNHATLENWDISFQLMTFRASYPRFASMVNRSVIVHIQSKYLEVVQSFLDRELLSTSNRPGLNSGAEGISRYLEPNYKNYIMDRENTLNTLLLHCGDYFGEDVFDAGVAMTMSKLLAVIASVSGVNFAHNFLSFFGSWQLTKHSTSAASVAKDVCAYLLLITCIQCLNDNYQDLLSEDISRSSLSYAILQDVKERKKQLWKLGEHSHPFVEKHGGPLSNHVNLGLIEEFFGRTPLKQWLLSPNSVLVDFENGENHVSQNGGVQDGLTFSADDNSIASVIPYPGNKLGLGTANDISSIYSGLNNGHTNGHTNGRAFEHLTPDTSQWTQATLQIQKMTPSPLVERVHVPRVEDLKNSIAGTDSNGGFKQSPRSVFPKTHRTRDVRSILAELKSDDDRHIVI